MTSVAEGEIGSSAPKMDHVFVFNDSGAKVDEFTFNAETGKLLASTRVMNARYKVEIDGKLYKKEANNDGGFDYHCWTSETEICYSK